MFVKAVVLQVPIPLLKEIAAALNDKETPVKTVHPAEGLDGDWHFAWEEPYGKTTAARVVRNKQDGKPLYVEFREVHE